MLFVIHLPHDANTALPQLCERHYFHRFNTLALNIQNILVIVSKTDPLFVILSNSRSQLILNWFSSGRVVFQVPDWLHHLLMGTRILFKNTLEMYTDYYLQCKLEQLFQEHRLVSLITLLRGLCLMRLCFLFCACDFS